VAILSGCGVWGCSFGIVVGLGLAYSVLGPPGIDKVRLAHAASCTTPLKRGH
jgi:hypothetical protein